MRTAQDRYRCYSAAMADVARPRVFEDRPCYRLLDVAADDTEPVRLTFGQGTFFDVVDVCEAVAHELAQASMGGDLAIGVPKGLGFRTLVGAPWDLDRRSVIPAISVLTIRQSAIGPATFVLHRRDPAKVAHAGGMVQVMPVGVFQPSGPGADNERNDFDLLRSITREYSEEFLGESERASDDGPIDYDSWPLYAALRAAQLRGLVRLHWLGIGIDPLSLAADMLVVAVFDDGLYDQLFAQRVTINAEGIVIGSRGPATSLDPGIPFTADAIAAVTRRHPLQPAGAALLDLAWHHRHALWP